MPDRVNVAVLLAEIRSLRWLVAIGMVFSIGAMTTNAARTYMVSQRLQPLLAENQRLHNELEKCHVQHP